ncbi:MAG: hypothetical protein PHS32_08355 [Rhodoferax sp.]|uniref:hypothetical protein n=1 Tax=Rhodoferax sp. TaxID=50421 RepID=UPI0026073584|nr:hypothetical protein [Rhodoferax sp.]MDD5333744.1 hypothetical protein [Rhodoferax sp.]
MKSKIQPAALVAFCAKEVAHPLVAWVNQKIFSPSEAVSHAGCMAQGQETEADYLTAQRVLNADRYGGYGVGYCGGSARCGACGDIQIKGVGLTPLMGSQPGAPVDPWHSSGTVTMNEAGREAIWSGICDAALPFGAVPTLAVVLTGTQCLRTDTAPGVTVLNRRALIMRAMALRPAHFMRNVHFKTALMPGAGVCEDYQRVSSMIASLPAALVDAFGDGLNGESATARVNMGLKLMARRFAAQVAAAFAKRLYHSSLNCSNIALDGRYLDFGTMTAVSAYRRQAGSPLWPDFWSQHTPLLRTLTYLLFHVGKYLDCPDIKSLVSPADLTVQFNDALQQRMEIEMLKQTGIPEQAISVYSPTLRSRAHRCFKAIYTCGANTSFVWRGDDDPSMIGVQPLQSLGRYDLNDILIKAAPCRDAVQLQGTVAALIDDAALAAEFCAVYTDLVDWFLASQPGMDAVMARQFLARQATRLNADVSHLTREALDAAMATFEEDPGGLGAFIDSTICHAKEIMCDEPPELVMPQGRRIKGLNAQLEALCVTA